jgi:hypothetical protein
MTFTFAPLKSSNITSFAALKVYFQQRLGHELKKIPGIILTKDQYQELLHGHVPILGQLVAQSPQAAAELFVGIFPEPDSRVLLTFHLDEPAPGELFCKEWELLSTTEDHRALSIVFNELSEKMKDLFLKQNF